MKIFYRILLCVLLPIVVVLGLVLMLTGADQRGMTFAIGIPAIFVVLIIGWFMAPSKPKTEQAEDAQAAAQAAETAQQEQVQELEPAQNLSLDVPQIEPVKEYPLETPREYSKSAVVMVIAVIIFLVADVVAATVLLINRIFAGAIACAAVFAVILIPLVIYLAIRDRIDISKNVRYAKKIVGGNVRSCELTDTDKLKSREAIMTSGICYKVTLAAEDGAEYYAYSDRSYEIDEKIFVAVMSKSRGIIVEESEIANIKLDGWEIMKKGMPTAGRTSIRARHHHHHHHH